MSIRTQSPIERPELIAHRGYAARFPENTLESIEAAFDVGARYVEIDVQMTADHHLVLSHDIDLMRTAEADINVLASTLEQVQRVTVGEPARLKNEFPDVRMPTLADAVHLLHGHSQSFVFVELKRQSLEWFGRDVIVDKTLASLQSLADRVCVISFDLTCLEIVRAKLPCSVGWVISEWSDAMLQAARTLAPAFLFADVDLLPTDDCQLPDGPWEWAIYEITTADEAMQLAQRGCRFIETMNVGKLIEDSRLNVTGP